MASLLSSAPSSPASCRAISLFLLFLSKCSIISSKYCQKLIAFSPCYPFSSYPEQLFSSSAKLVSAFVCLAQLCRDRASAIFLRETSRPRRVNSSKNYVISVLVRKGGSRGLTVRQELPSFLLIDQQKFQLQIIKAGKSLTTDFFKALP